MEWENLDERKRFLVAFLGLCEAFAKQSSDALPRIYHRALSDFSIEQVERAVDMAVVSLRFFPKPVELREIITGPAEALEDRAEVEAAKVIEAVKSVGSWRSVVFDDPITNAVVQTGFGGWVKLCQDLTAKDEKWTRKDFVRLYAAYARQGVEHFGVLAGQAAITNGGNCIEHNEVPALIGNSENARRVAIGAGSATCAALPGVAMAPDVFRAVLDRVAIAAGSRADG
ncbi:DUF6475 domain-containing protein [Desulfovibrio psychrotolerans]|uniref:DUF6475 domain-containing protein n=1 Tax=Desulfovibrio psychrotolerans TaxID=415242 RepID=A0A7J0BX60_9BACT|nr:DUF6475 domain-containing protein [Desulfovibrio psychrotolerans]GFM38299.1 hypothetical protein DSM19430T_29830 [Desulfovibrio psychrotolerans]